MSPFVVSRAAPHELLPACRLLFAGTAEGARAHILDAAEPTAVFVARAADGLCAAALVQALPGALGLAWPPRGGSPAAEDAATAAACRWLRSQGVKVCQSFAAAGAAAGMAPLERAGFRHTTELVFLRRDLTPVAPPLPPPAQSLTLIADAPPFSEAFAAALLATHDGTLDCPELNAARAPAELLAGFTPQRGESYLARHGGDPIGVVTFEPGPEPDTAELTYLGVVPAERGRGLGAELLTFVITEASRAGARRLMLSVDARNAPAMKLYARHGFAEYDRRGVWLAAWPG